MQTCSTYFSFFWVWQLCIVSRWKLCSSKVIYCWVRFLFLRNQSNQMRRHLRGALAPPLFLPPNMCQSVWVYVWFDQIKRQPVCLTHPHRARDIGIAIWRQAFEMHLVFACLALRVRVWVLQPHFIRNIHREEHLRVVRPNPYTHTHPVTC